jgi:hypothetical protein
MKHNHHHDSARSASLQPEPVRFSSIHPTTAAASAVGALNDRHAGTEAMHFSGNALWRASCRFLLSCLFFTAAFARGEPVVVGYTNCLAVADYPQSLIDQIGQLKWYFAHASVGLNMMDGVAALHAAGTNLYQFTSAPEDGAPPTTTLTRTIYEYNRGNPGWQVMVGSPDPTGFDLVLNDTPVGMAPHDPLPVEAERLEAAAWVADLITRPAVTPLLETAHQRGCSTVSGADMFAVQAGYMADILLGAAR